MIKQRIDILAGAIRFNKENECIFCGKKIDDHLYGGHPFFNTLAIRDPYSYQAQDLISTIHYDLKIIVDKFEQTYNFGGKLCLALLIEYLMMMEKIVQIQIETDTPLNGWLQLIYGNTKYAAAYSVLFAQDILKIKINHSNEFLNIVNQLCLRTVDSEWL